MDGALDVFFSLDDLRARWWSKRASVFRVGARENPTVYMDFYIPMLENLRCMYENRSMMRPLVNVTWILACTVQVKASYRLSISVSVRTRMFALCA